MIGTSHTYLPLDTLLFVCLSLFSSIDKLLLCCKHDHTRCFESKQQRNETISEQTQMIDCDTYFFKGELRVVLVNGQIKLCTPPPEPPTPTTTNSASASSGRAELGWCTC